jgi:heme-degrading monooxygenase HmoA
MRGYGTPQGTFDALRHRYVAECVPTVRAAEGSIDCFVLESADSAAEVAICTVWRTEADAIAYEASGRAAEMVDRVREFLAGRPALTSIASTTARPAGLTSTARGRRDQRPHSPRWLFAHGLG